MKAGSKSESSSEEVESPKPVIETQTPTKDKLVRSVCKPKIQETHHTPIVKLGISGDWDLSDGEMSEFNKEKPNKQTTSP